MVHVHVFAFAVYLTTLF